MSKSFDGQTENCNHFIFLISVERKKKKKKKKYVPSYFIFAAVDQLDMEQNMTK